MCCKLVDLVGTRQRETLRNSRVVLVLWGMKEMPFECHCGRFSSSDLLHRNVCQLLQGRFWLVYLFLICDCSLFWLHFPGVISCILHSQRRIWFRQAAYCQYLHELAEASWVLWRESDAKQAPLCHWMCCWIWTQLSPTDAYLDDLQRNEPVPTL